MSGAARKMKRKKKKDTGPEIQLSSPNSAHFKTFIAGNATKCENVVKPDSALGQHLVLCGAGPSLRDHADEWCPQADQIWGCNSAAIWLQDNGHNPTHGFCIDQTPAMLNEWATAPDLEYLLASSVHPHLVDYLQERGRRTTFFHNYVGLADPPVAYCACGHDECEHDAPGLYAPTAGMACSKCACPSYDKRMLPFEDWLYNAAYPECTVKAGSGLNSVTRAIDVGHFMGFSEITVLGADCALRVKRPCPDGVAGGSPEHTAWLRDDTEMHADGGHALSSGATAVTCGGEIDGRWWETKWDMMITAVWLVRMGRALGPGFRLIGDTLPNAIKDKSDKFLDRLPALVGTDGNPIKCPMPAHEGAGLH